MNVVNFRKQKQNVLGAVPKKWQGEDNIFLHRSQINIGLELIYFGRLDHGSIWRVIEIKTYSPGGRATKVAHINSLGDTVVMLRRGSNETRQISFSYLSYSAIWRVFK